VDEEEENQNKDAGQSRAGPAQSCDLSMLPSALTLNPVQSILPPTIQAQSVVASLLASSTDALPIHA